MFGRTKPVVFDRYASSRSRRFIPSWLWLLLFGGAIGAGAVVYVQQQHLPPRLSAVESSKLQSAFDSAEHERSRLAAELAQLNRKLQAVQAEQTRVADELAVSHRDRSALSDNIEALLASLPPDPRGGAVEVRAARFNADGDTLGYNVVLARAKAGPAPFTGVLQIVVVGKTVRGAETTVTLDPIKVTVGRYEIASGTMPMPGGFNPREATIRVLDRVDGKSFGMRVIYVK
jgi:hypothetical protein